MGQNWQDWGVNQPIPKTIHSFFKKSLNDIALQISAIQDQINSSAVVVLQNRREIRSPHS
jgi:hypothetical protein